MPENGERDMRRLDPAKLLPDERELEPHDPNVEKLPQQHSGSGDDLYAEAAVF
jgi:hypothetical protein